MTPRPSTGPSRNTENCARMHHDQFWRLDSTRSERAREIALEIVSSEQCPIDLARYYQTEGPYAGATFVDLAPVDPFTVTARDLLAATTLSVSVAPVAIRRFVDRADELSAQLREIPETLTLEAVDSPHEAAAMAAFYASVKACLYKAGAQTGNAWVTASKICARKRSQLFPVRDRVVMTLLGLKGNYADDWPVFAALIGDAEIRGHLDAAVQRAAQQKCVGLGDPGLRLRHLDVALWMSGR